MSGRALRLGQLAAAVVAAGILAGCEPANLDGFFYDPLKTPAADCQRMLSFAIIPGCEDLSVPTTDGQTLRGAFVVSSGRRPDITIVYFHGQNSNLATTWPRLEDLYPLGYNLVMIDPRGYGQSTGAPTEAGLQIDERAILEAVGAHAGVDPKRLVFYGRSLGSALAIDLAYQELPAAAATPPLPPAPAVLITESAFTSVAALVNDATYVDFPSSFVSKSVWNSLAKIASIQAPYLLFHGSADDYVDPKYSEELAAAHPPGDPGSPEIVRLVRVPGANHDDVPDVLGLDVYRDEIQSFVEMFIPGP